VTGNRLQVKKFQVSSFKFQVWKQDSGPWALGFGLWTSATIRNPQSAIRNFGTPNGFTLLEVMVALAILAIGIASVLELFGGGLRLTTKASRRTQAVVYAQNVMDRFLAQSTLEDGADGGQFPGGFSWNVQVYEIHPDDESSRLQPNRQSPTDFFHLKHIEVGVYWSEGNGEQSYVLRSLRTTTEQPQTQAQQQ